MKHEVIISIIFYICACFYMVFGAAKVAKRSGIHNLFLFLTSSLATWAFSYSISNSAPTAEASAFWRSFSAFGWGVYNSFLLHFILVLTEFDSRFNKRNTLVLLYLPALINIILFGPFGCLVEKHYQMVLTDFGWVSITPMYAGKVWLNLYYVVFSIASIILLIRWYREIEPHAPEHRDAKYFVVSILLLFLIEALVDALPDILGRNYFPKLAVVFLIIPTIMLYRVLRKTGQIKKIGEAYSFPESSKELSGDRLRLFKTITAILILGGALSFLIRYFGMKGKLEHELLLAAVLVALGSFVRFVPLLTSRQTIQNTIFLTIAALATLYYSIAYAETGAVTIWSMYIIFLLFTVILESPIHAYVFTAISVIIQVVFWILYPEIPVIINGNEYIARITIIVLSYITVQYISNEFTLKMQDYQGLAKEQEVLENISSSFISINNENAYEKVDEMMEMAVEILNFDNAYLFDFDADYENAMILNMYVKDNEAKSSPFYLKMNFKIADFLPLFQSLTKRSTPLICEDTSKLPIDEDGGIRNFFLSRGVNSFITLPLIVDARIDGILLVEYNERLDTSLAQNRLNFLQIIANILGDARKKTLYEERLYHSAYFDETTKLANMNMLRKRLGEIIDERKESGKIAIIDIELENLRMINDAFGHRIGEEIIIKSAAILEELMGEFCYISRSSEREFVLVFPNVEDCEQIEQCAERILASFANPVLTDTGIEALFVVVLMGISVYPDHGRDADTLLKNADLARFEAKTNNEKIVFYSEELENTIAENTFFTNRLFKSLENEEFFLEYQPQISCNTEKIVGVEALLRWMSDGKKRVPPDRFVPILEQTGLIYDVGLWVLQEALQEHKRLIAKGFPPLRISVNLSIVQFQGEDFIGVFRKIIGGSGVNPKYIELEVTENVFSKNPEDAIKKLHRLKDLGVSIAIDDFGRGYSSLNRLNLLPFDRLKVDKEIVDYIDLERKRAPVMETIVTLGKAFSADITAEGVETKEQVEFLKSLACDEIQGYYYSRPLSPEALEEFLKNECYGLCFAN